MTALTVRFSAVCRGPKALPIALALATFAIYSPALWNGFVDWDDTENFINNPHFRGLGWEQLRWMFTTSMFMGHWIPVTWFTLGLDYVLWGLHPFGYHLVNLLFHAANAGVAYVVACRLLSAAMRGVEEIPLRLGAGVAALFFALHPLRAESVAWVTERRDVVSGLFFLLAILAYLKAVEGERARARRWLAASVGFYLLALASKAIVMTLPLILILLDLYPLRRITGRWRDWLAPDARRLWREKIPYLIPAVIVAAIALYANRVATSPTGVDKLPASSHVTVALWSVWFYVWKTFVPSGLSPTYEMPARVSLLAPQFLAAVVAVGLLTGGFWLLRRRCPGGLAVWVGYLVILLPVSGLFHNLGQLAADRHSYLACLGWSLLVGAAVSAVAQGAASRQLARGLASLALGAVAVWLVGLAVLTWNQVQIWRDAETLWQSALDVDPDCAWCHNNLGVVLGNRGLFPQAIEHFDRAVSLKPNFLIGHQNLGFLLLQTGHPADAGPHFERALSRDPENVDARANLADALLGQGRPADALRHLELAVRWNKTHVHALTSLGMALVELGRAEEALPYLQRVIALRENTALPHLTLSRAYLALGNTAAAREQAAIVQRLNPRVTPIEGVR